MENMMRLEQIHAYYGKKEALSGVSLKIPKNQITAVIGPSGCGKSTLLRVLNGSFREESGTRLSGQVFLGDKDAASIPSEELHRRVGLVFQTPSPFPFSILKNMTYAPQYYGVRDKKRLMDIALEKLKLAGLYEEVRDELSKSALRLSGGQQQRLCIARALTVEPEVLLLDEPCSALDVKASMVIERLLMELKKQYTIVIVTHNIAQARRLADQAVFINAGRLVESGEGKAFFAAPKEEETREFLGGEF